MKEERGSMERWNKLLRGEEVDRVPVVPLGPGYEAIACGYENLGDFFAKPEVMVKCQVLARELYGVDQPPFLIPDNYWGGQWGSEVELPYRKSMSAPSVKKSVVTSPEELEELEMPDPREEMQNLHEKVRIAIEEYDERPLVQIAGGSVSGTAPMLVSIEDFMKWTRTNPDLCRKALEMTADFAIETVEWFVEDFGTDNWIPWDALPTDANVLISAENFGDLVVPSLKRLHQEVLDMGLPMWFTHWCSDHNKNIEAGHIDEIPHGERGIIWFGPEVDVERSVELFGDEHIIGGNVDPPSVQNKSYEEVLELSKENIEKGKDSPTGYFLTVGCGIPPFAPPMNIYAMVKASKKYGRY
ncbi:MAG: Methylcobalamin:coenzyme M methyltransferase MtbA [Candidatus Methanohalarchaeum thermophilum]|uniref:Methylcobalamin:coenzyme M methyltransferase MtbA n=1 Tax=Methanohalarchaeum thermophilum TaxID=1903181 RepID=A0A1Q6DTC1_METT1|nr:MAG: Methylcobalamin:coenzyme M methyltransferase MtbA [Candidatus Methanohalarchaeum thermophilum]